MEPPHFDFNAPSPGDYPSPTRRLDHQIDGPLRHDRRFTTEAVTLPLQQYKVARRVPLNTLLSSYETVNPATLVKEMVIELEAKVLSHQTVSDTKRVNHEVAFDHQHHFPASPWQFFKQRHADSWWLRWLVTRRPVQTTRHTVRTHKIITTEVRFERYDTYPQATVRLPEAEFGRPYVLERYSVG